MTHPELAAKLKKYPFDIHENVGPDECGTIHMLVGIASEVGKLIDSVKKHLFYSRYPLDMKYLIEELGDIEFFMESFRQRLGISREEILNANTAKLLKRYPKARYTDKDALERKDKTNDSSTQG